MSKLNMKEWIKRNYPKERGGGYAHHDPSGHRDDRENGARCGY